MNIIEVMDKFEHGELFIDISIERNPYIIHKTQRLSEILSEYSGARPYNGTEWSEYLDAKIGEWKYLRCKSNREDVTIATASDEFPLEMVLTVDEVFEAQNEYNKALEEQTAGFDDIFA